MTPPINSVSDERLAEMLESARRLELTEWVSAWTELTAFRAARRAANTPVGLEWVGDEAKTPFGSYKVERTDDGYAALFGYDEIAHVGFNAVDTPPGARKAAQEHAEADWRGRVSCLTSPAAEPEVIAWVETRTMELTWQNKVVATNPDFVIKNGKENFTPLIAYTHPAPSASREVTVTDEELMAPFAADLADMDADAVEQAIRNAEDVIDEETPWLDALCAKRRALLAALPEREG